MKTRNQDIEILEPKNQLERLNLRGVQQVIASNITQILLITAPLPIPNFLLIDKFILISELMEFDLTIILNKIDLTEDRDDQFKVYKKIGYPVIKISAKNKIKQFCRYWHCNKYWACSR